MKTYAFVDPGTYITAIRIWIPDWNRKQAVVISKSEWAELASSIIHLLDSWDVNTLALEYNPEYREPIRKTGSWGVNDFKRLLEIITQVREWAMNKGINTNGMRLIVG